MTEKEESPGVLERVAASSGEGFTMTAGFALTFVMLLGLMAGLLLWFGPRSRLEGPRGDFSMFWGNGAPAEVRGQGDGDLYMDIEAIAYLPGFEDGEQGV